MNKPSTLKISTGTIKWATTVVTTTGLDSDQAILSLMQYQKILDDLESGYRAAKRSGMLCMLIAHADEMKKALEDWSSSLPGTLRASGISVPCPLDRTLTEMTQAYLRIDTMLQEYAFTR